MFSAIFVFAFITTCVCTCRTFDIHVCGRNDSNYNQCITDNILNLKDKFCKGSPEFPSIEPLHFDRISIINETNIKLYTFDSKVTGLCDFIINSVHVDSDRLHFNFDFQLKQLNVQTAFEFAAHVLVPISHKGLIFIVSDVAQLKVRLDLKVIVKDGKKHIYASGANTNMKLKDFYYKFDEKEKGSKQFQQIFKNIIDNNKSLVLSNVIPEIEKKFSELFIKLFNNVTQSNYDKFFPEKV